MSKTIKHLFYSHSWITQLVIEAYIKKEEIPHEDLLILTNRNFYQSIDQDLLTRFVNIRKLKFPNWIHALLSFDKLRRFDQWVNKITRNRKFILYVPHFYPVEIKVLVLNKNCSNVYLIEEGELSYKRESYINTLENHHHTLLKKKYLNFFWDKKLYNALTLETIEPNVISGTLQMFEEAFPYSPKKIILINDIKELVMNTLPSLENLKNILVLTPYVDVFKLNPEIYFKELERVMAYITENLEDIIHYKFHPSDSEFVRQRTNQLAEKFGGQFILLSNDISLESILIKSKPRVFSFLSSISIYAYFLECKLNIMSDFMSTVRPNTNINAINLEPYVVQPNKVI